MDYCDYSPLKEFQTDTCIINIEHERDIDKYVVYTLDVSNHWFYLARFNERKQAVYFGYKFFACHPHFTRLSINYVNVK